MRQQMYSNQFTILAQSNGECNLRFMAVRPIQDEAGNILTNGGQSGKNLRKRESDAELPTMELISEQFIFMSYESLKNMYSEIGRIIDDFDKRMQTENAVSREIFKDAGQ